MIPEKYLLRVISQAIEEDLGDGDHSSLCCIPENIFGKAKLIAKQNGIVCGIDIAEKVFKFCHENIEIRKYKNDGDIISTGDIILDVYGSKAKILQAERTALNFMQRLSGIASETNIYTKELEGLKTKLLDTRKTTPGLRLLEKYAVKKGGGENHRIGLYDMIMLKDNHIDFAGGIEKAILNANKYLIENSKNLKIEIEVRNFEELNQVLNIGKIDRIMLDNFSVEDTKKAVDKINNRFEIESSGGITIKNIRDYAMCGVDYISVGAITHQIKSLDLSLVVY